MVDLREVIDAQRRLGVRPTGRVNEETYLAVRAFQLEAGLLVTGELDAITLRRLYEERLLDH